VEEGDLLVAAALLQALRRAGCVVTMMDGNTLNVTGAYTDVQDAMIAACKEELAALLAIEGAAPAVTPEVATSTPKAITTAISAPSWPTPQPGSLLSMIPPRPSVVPMVVTREFLIWKARRDDAQRDGRPFDEPAPKWVPR
jgi:hypothetical protein